MIETSIRKSTLGALKELYNADISEKDIIIQKTRKEFEGDYTINVFPFLKLSHQKPEQTAEKIGEYILKDNKDMDRFNVIKGFLNIVVKDEVWTAFLANNAGDNKFGISKHAAGAPYVIEYSSPNTNKPLHLGHIRNNLLGWSVAEILKASGKNVVKVNLVNDRGIHICKSMLAWEKWYNGQTPESARIKGDKLVGDCYVRFDKEMKAELAALVDKGISPDEAEKKSALMKEAREMLQKWEQNDTEIRKLWTEMNKWVYTGVDQTYKRLGVAFDKIYYESDTYLLGKEIVVEGLDQGILFKKEDGSVWAGLSEE
ncbi:MAG: arginine--tRNA ligase, partial [Bacteroidota bacterium]